MDKKSFTRSGIVLINKPVGVSSNKVVNIVKYALGAKKAGHLGTLDLEGQGLLPVTINNATKLFDYFLGKDKTYETIFVFGFETDTLDTSGKIIKEKECDVSEGQVENAIKQMIGKYMQMPPQYSAKKVNGQTAYKAARAGKVVELKPKEVEIFDFTLLEKVSKNTFKFSVSCSSGTYIRSLCRDLAEKLGTYGSMQCITRTRCGNFFLKDANTLEEIEKGNLKIIFCDSVFDYAKYVLATEDFGRLLNGQSIKVKVDDGKYKLYNKNEFVGIGNVENKILKFELRLI